MLSGKIRLHGLRQMDAAKGGAGKKPVEPDGEPPALTGMKAIHILIRIDRLNDLQRIDMLRQRQLHKDAVHILIGIEATDQRQQLASLVLSGSTCSIERMPASTVATPFAPT